MSRLRPPIVGRLGIKGDTFGCGSAGGTGGVGGVYQRALSGDFAGSVIYSFGEPDQPAFQCYLDQASAAGLLYGVSVGGGRYGQGAFFELDPPATQGGAWGEKVDIDFNPATSCAPGRRPPPLNRPLVERAHRPMLSP